MNTTMPAVVYSPDDRWGNQTIYFDDSVRESILDGIDGYRQSIELAPDPTRPGEYLEAAGVNCIRMNHSAPFEGAKRRG